MDITETKDEAAPLLGKRKLRGANRNVPLLLQKLASKEAREEILAREKTKKETDSKVIAFYEEVETIPKDQNIPDKLVDKYFDVQCDSYLADFLFSQSIIKSILDDHDRQSEPEGEGKK